MAHCSRWEWADPDLALDLALWLQGQYVRPWVGPFHQKCVASLTHWVHKADPNSSKFTLTALFTQSSKITRSHTFTYLISI